MTVSLLTDILFTNRFSPIPFVGGFISWVASAIGFILWILLMVMAVQGKKYKLPWTGDLAEKWS